MAQEPAEEIYAAAERPRVPLDVFLRRIQMGWTADRALHTALDGRFLRPPETGTGAARSAVLFEVLGRKRTLQQWAESTGIDAETLRKGAKRYGSLQSYLLNLGWYPSKPATPGDPDITDDRFTD